MSASPAPIVDRRARLLAYLMLVAGAALTIPLYRSNRLIGALPETISAAMTAHSLVRERNADLTEYFPDTVTGRVIGYAFRWRGDALYSFEPLASSITFAPFFLPYREIPPAKLDRKRANSAVAAEVAALTLVVLGSWLLTIAPSWQAVLTTAVVALGTCFRTIVGAGLWTHTSALLWLSLGLLLWTRSRPQPALFPLAGVALSFAAACRPILFPIAACLVLDAWLALVRHKHQRIIVASTSVAIVAIGVLVLYSNWRMHGSLLGGRAGVVASITETHAVPAYFHFSILHLVGLLAAPSRGLFVYSPVLLFAIPGLVASLHAPASHPFRWMTIAALVTFVLYGFIATWWAGYVFGPRYMADLLPFFALWLVLSPPPRRARPLVAVAFTLALAWSITVQQLAATTYPCGWDQSPQSIDKAPERLWSLHDTEIGRCVEKLRSAWR